MTSFIKKNWLLILMIIVSLGYLLLRNSFAKAAPSQIPPVSKNDFIQGSPSAQLILVEYSDLECPYCINFHKTMQQIMKDYNGKIAWVFRNYPLSFHANAQKEAEAAICAADLDGNQAFWKYTDAVYSRTKGGGTGFPLDQLVPLAKEQGLDEVKFKSCLDGGKAASRIKSDQEAGIKAGVQGTPMTFIVTKNGTQDVIAGALPYEQVKSKIDTLLK